MATRLDAWQGTNKSRRKACGECRRLKLRCEKVFPCESCQKRGCAAICPDGSFMKGTRSLKTSALKLHEKMAHMSSRIQQLEEALSNLQAAISAETHPLLQPTEDDERSPIPVTALSEANVFPSDSPDQLTEALGTLTIRPFGESQFHGETASSEYLLQVNADRSVLSSTAGWDAASKLRLPPDLILFSVLFPFPPSIPGDPINTDRFVPHLPEYIEALRLVDVYFTNFSWCCRPISREELHDSILADVYPNGQNPTNLQHMSLHRLSILLMVFALGSLFDIEKPLCPSEAEEYHALARAALCGEQIFNNTTIDCVQSMSLMVWYMRMCPGRRSTGYLWAFSGLLSKLVQAIGLHRESSKSLNPAEGLRRQTTFWEFISGDVWQSFVYGRPSSMVFSQIDCKKPREFGVMENTTDGLFYRWKYSFTHLVGDVLSQTTGATTTSYREILNLEHKLREFPISSELQLPEASSPGALGTVPISLALQRYVIRLWKHTTIMYIHRRFLAQAIRTNADDLSKSPYSQSVCAAYESACIHIQDLRDLYDAHQHIVCRMQPYWSHSFSASIVLGALVLRSPSCNLAPTALAHLDQACELFSDAAGRSVQPVNAVELMTNLQRKARFGLAQHQSYHGDNTQPSNELVVLGTASQALELSTSLGNGSSSSPKSSSSQSPVGTSPLFLSHVPGTSVSRRGLPTPISASTSPTELYLPSSHHSAQAQSAAQWLQQQAYFPPQPGSEGQELADTPRSSSSGGQVELTNVDQSDWPHGFMRSMGV